ncbi:ATP-binding protein [Cupriavidus sp. SS-3]|uniref:ATP-binding protein n=1 Tax=Cupriavidus sp. SS-3 TaxID=3109596 RepID=UPI002DBB62B8|nr:ATP-binding protein [Cupriavidus sp. SS-3]MEC3768779.1 ATP-binding protein [Cupriavidus sp. SS-3]
MSEAILDDIRSRLQTGTHPLLAHESNTPLWTPPIRHAYAACKLCILQRRSFYVSEVKGEGKTSLLRALREQLPNDFGSSIATLHYSAANRQVPSIRAFFIEFLRSINHPTLSGETPRLKARVCDSLEVLASTTLWNTVVLLLDEAQAFLPEDFDFLKDIQNELVAKRYSLIVVTCGEDPYLKAKLDSMQTRGRAGACADRFGLHRVRLRGYNKASLQALLRAVDIKVWPNGSGCSWAQYFFPQAVADGYRFENNWENLWNAFAGLGLIRAIEIVEGANKKVEEYLLSRRIFEALSYFVVRVADDDFKNGSLETKYWDAAAAHAAGMLDD